MLEKIGEGGFGVVYMAEQQDPVQRKLALKILSAAACFSNCPVYTFLCNADGSCHYEGVGNVQRKGNFTGRIPPEDFNRIAQFIKDSGYMDLQGAYRPRAQFASDFPKVWTMVVANDKRKVVENYQNAGPTTLWATEQLIDALLAKAQWDATPKTEEKKK